jgi:adenylyltransferase/sulfurtransferase
MVGIKSSKHDWPDTTGKNLGHNQSIAKNPKDYRPSVFFLLLYFVILFMTFTKPQLNRYARHIILPNVGAQGQQKLLESKVLVIGAGGLGSPILMYLAAAGVGTLGIVDFDTVDLSNLQRQIVHTTPDIGKSKTLSAQEHLRTLNPDVNIIPYQEALNSQNARQILQNYDLVMDGSDNFPTRYLVNDACVLENKPLLYGAISQFEGQLSLFHADNEAPCYRCLFPTPPKPGTVPSCAEAGVFGVLPGVVGSFMATEAIKFLLGLGEVLSGILLHYDGLYSETRKINIGRNPKCVVCGDNPSITELIDYEAFCA